MTSSSEDQYSDKQLQDIQEKVTYSPAGYLEYWPAIVVALGLTTAIFGLSTEPGLTWMPTLPVSIFGTLLLLAIITVPRLKKKKEESWERLEREAQEKAAALEAQAKQLAAETVPTSEPEAAAVEEVPETVVLEAISPVKASDVDVLVLWGSETGNAEGLAEVTAAQLSDSGMKAQAVDMAQVTLPALPDFGKILILTSTWGDGEPPSNAIGLWESFQKVNVDMSKTRFSVLSLGDTSYPEFCKCGKDFDEFLASKGAQRVHPRVDCDLDYQTAFDGWLTGVKSALG